MGDLRLPCTARDGDYVECQRVGDEVRFEMRQEDDVTHCYLSPESYRKLFNWLGVQLHTFAGSGKDA